MKSAQKVNYLWSLKYDEQSYAKPFLKVPFSQILNMLISMKYFGQFQSAAAAQMMDRSLWDQQCWAILQLFNFLNKFIDFQQIDNKINFIQDSSYRKTLGHLRLWIDLQRLYLITFLKLDKIKFQEDRIYLALFRMNKFFFQFLSQYEKSNFSEVFMDELQTKLIYYLVNLRQFVKTNTSELIQYIISCIKNYFNNKILRDPIKEQQYAKIAYMKISAQASMLEGIQKKLNINVAYKDNVRRMKELLKNQNISLDDLEQLYDPTFKLMKEFKQQLKEKKQPYDDQKLKNMVYEFRSKEKMIKSTENVYNKLMKNGHNPYDKNNYNIFGDSIGIDLSMKEKFQKVQVKNMVQTESLKQEIIYYHPKFLDVLKQVNYKSASVQQSDLASKFDDTESKKKGKMSINPKVTNINWVQEDNFKMQNLNTAPTASRNIENNVLFKQDDQHIQQTYATLINNFLSKRYQSQFLNNVDKQLQQIRNSRMNNKIMKFSLKKCEFIEVNKFDVLRKVLFYTIAEEKLKILIKKQDFPNYYPRFVDEITTLDYCANQHQDQLFKAIGYSYY